MSSNPSRPPKPMMLKDYLELDSFSESSGAGFRCAPRWADQTVKNNHIFRRRLSINPFTKISGIVFSAVKFLPFASYNDKNFLPRSLSKKLRGWKRKTATDDEERFRVRVRVMDIVLLDERSWRFAASPIVSRCSSWVVSEMELETTMMQDDGENGHSPVRIQNRDEDAGEIDSPEEINKNLSYSCSEEEKEQLSPVSIMDFPSEEDEDEEKLTDSDSISSPSFHQTLANIERTKLELLQKIKRFEGLADLDPIDLDCRFARCENDSESVSDLDDSNSKNETDDSNTLLYQKQAWDLLCHVMHQSSSPLFAGPAQRSIQKLLLDFFIQGLTISCPSDTLNHSRPFSWYINKSHCESLVEHKLLNTASMYMDGEIMVINGEMEMNGRWRCIIDDDELGLDLEGLIVESLVEEMVMDLLIS